MARTHHFVIARYYFCLQQHLPNVRNSFVCVPPNMVERVDDAGLSNETPLTVSMAACYLCPRYRFAGGEHPTSYGIAVV